MNILPERISSLNRPDEVSLEILPLFGFIAGGGVEFASLERFPEVVSRWSP